MGTLLTSVLTALGLYALGEHPALVWAPKLSFPQSLVFGASLSAVDTVATLALFQALNAPPTLFMLVFGESVVNDAASIVVFRAAQAYNGGAGGESFGLADAAQAIGSVLGVTAASVAFGALAGCTMALLTKHMRLHRHPPLEVGAVLLCPYLTYLGAEALGWSAVMAILSCGVCMGHYTFWNLSFENQLSTPVAADFVSRLAEGFVFAYLGMAVVTYPTHRLAPAFVCATTLLCYAARAVAVFPLLAACNTLTAPADRVPLRDQVVVWFAGGVRGAISFALALNSGDDTIKDLLVTTALAAIVLTLVLNGAVTAPLMGAIGAGRGIAADGGQPSSSASPGARQHSGGETKALLGGAEAAAAAACVTPGGAASGAARSPRSALWRWLAHADAAYLCRWLRADGGRRVDSIPEGVAATPVTMRKRVLSTADALRERAGSAAPASGRGGSAPPRGYGAIGRRSGSTGAQSSTGASRSLAFASPGPTPTNRGAGGGSPAPGGSEAAV